MVCKTFFGLREGHTLGSYLHVKYLVFRIRDSFYEELERVFDHFPKYHTKILLGDFNGKMGRENIFKPTTGNESLHQDNNDNWVTVVNFATSKNLVITIKMFPHRNFHQ